MKARSLRLGLACTGWAAGWAVHDAIARGAPAAVTFVASRRAARAQAYAEGHGVPRHGLWFDLLACKEVDAVYIAVPNVLHGPLVVDALRAGKHVLCEKPLTRDAATARALTAEAEANGVLLWEAMHYRWQDDVRAAVDFACTTLGVIQSVEAEFSYSFPPSEDIRYRPDLAGGALMDIGCYTLDFAQWILGDGAVVAASMVYQDTAVDVAASMTWRAGAAVGEADVSFLEPQYTCRATIVGEHGVAELDHLFTPVLPGPPASFPFRAHVGSRHFATAAGARTSYQCQLTAFAAAIEGGGRGAPPELVTRAESLEAAHLLSVQPVRSAT